MGRATGQGVENLTPPTLTRQAGATAGHKHGTRTRTCRALHPWFYGSSTERTRPYRATRSVEARKPKGPRTP